MFSCYFILHHNNVIVTRNEKNGSKIVPLEQMKFFLFDVLQEGTLSPFASIFPPFFLAYQDVKNIDRI